MQSPNGGFAHILLTDDDEATRDIWGTSLTLAGYRVEVATTGGETLEQVRARPPRLLLLDLVLPDMPGLEVVRRIRGSGAADHLVIVAFTARMPSEAEASALEAGCHGFLAKPVTPAEVLAKVRTLIGPAT